MGLSSDPATKISDLGIWGDGADSVQKLDTLAGRQVSSTPGKRSWRGHDPPLVITCVYVSMHTYMIMYMCVSLHSPGVAFFYVVVDYAFL